MINLSRDIQIIKEGPDLSHAVVKAIDNAKQCVMSELFNRPHIWPDPEEITAGSKNPFKRASIIKFFNQHDNPSIAPEYNATWVKKLYLAAQKAPERHEILELIPQQAAPQSVVSNTLRGLFKADALLILHFLWFEKAVLLPLSLAKPVTRDPDTGGQHFEYAANFYPETFALIRYPFLKNIRTKLVDFSEFLATSALENFNWSAWRFIRATDWHVIEDIDLDDVASYFEKTGDGTLFQDIPKYPIAPKMILFCFKEAFPSRCQFSMDDDRLKNTVRQATESAIEGGKFYVPASLEAHKDAWLFHERNFLKHKKRKISKWKDSEKALGILNAYLFEELPSKANSDAVPMPENFSRKFLEDHDGIPNLIEYVQQGRKSSTVRGILLAINQFMTYLESCSNTYEKLQNFRNPINANLDFPLLRKGNSTSKAVFGPDHFVPFLQYCYAVEAFGWFLSEKIIGMGQGHRFQKEIKHAITPNQRVFDTESLGFVPIVFVKNPEYEQDKPRSGKNRKMIAKPIFFLPKSLLPMPARRLKTQAGWTSFPALNQIQMTILMLETGIRGVHVRWLDRRTYDKDIDRSYPLPPICNLWVNTDKAHDEWGAKVSRSVIEVLDRQKKSHDWFDEPSIHEEAWYNNYGENNPFGKILTIFPAGHISGTGNTGPGPLSEVALSSHFKKTIFAFDLFCRYTLGIAPSNKMPEEFRYIESIDTAEELAEALKLFEQYKKTVAHTPHSCRASVVTHWITILPPNLIGDHITGHATVEHVLYYAKIDPSFLKRHEKYQKLAFENGFSWDESNISSIKAEDINSTLQKAFEKNKEGALYDFGAISYERPNSKGEVLSGVRQFKKQPLDAVTFHGTHICPFADQCPKDVVDDLKAIPGVRMPCGGCYYSVKTVDHLPRISGHVRSLIEESAELKDYIDDARKGGADPLTFKQKAEHRQFLADEISAWTVTMHCLDQMYQDIQGRDHFLVQQPEIVSEQLQQIVVDGSGLEYLVARVAEAKTNAEFFTPRLKSQLKLARAKILKLSGEYHRLLQDEPSGFTLLDEFRGIVRSTCETLGLSVHQLADEMAKPALTNSEGSQGPLKLIFDPGAKDNA